MAQAKQLAFKCDCSIRVVNYPIRVLHFKLINWTKLTWGAGDHLFDLCRWSHLSEFMHQCVHIHTANICHIRNRVQWTIYVCQETSISIISRGETCKQLSPYIKKLYSQFQGTLVTIHFFCVWPTSFLYAYSIGCLIFSDSWLVWSWKNTMFCWPKIL